MRKAAFCLLAAALMSGCGAAPVKRYFEIRTIGTAEPPLPRLERRICVEPAAVDSPYDDTRILYRVTPYELKYYPYEFWVDRPGRQVTAAMAEFLAKMKVFPVVTEDRTKGEPEILLRSRLHAVEEIDGADIWEGRLAMDIEFLDAKSGAPIVTWAFDRKTQMLKREVGILPAVLSRILDEELRKAVWELAHALEKK
jgi:ABC-type uncharacterized transport system auxiliary subunit